MIAEYMEPLKLSQKDDKLASMQLRVDYDKLLERLHELEAFALI